MSLMKRDCRSEECCSAVPTERRATYVPPVQIYEGEDAFQLVAEVPGADDQSTEVTVEKGVLTVSAQMTAPKPDGAKLAYSEFRDGCYRRSFQLSDAVDPRGIEATVAKGVLTVRLPKTKSQLPQKVPVVAG